MCLEFLAAKCHLIINNLQRVIFGSCGRGGLRLRPAEWEGRPQGAHNGKIGKLKGEKCKLRVSENSYFCPRTR